MKVHWTDRAKARLREIENHIAKDNPKAAKKVVRRLLLKSKQISEYPYSDRKVPQYQRDALREMLERPYRIIYNIRSDRIDVITVMHYRQLLPNDYKKL